MSKRTIETMLSDINTVGTFGDPAGYFFTVLYDRQGEQFVWFESHVELLLDNIAELEFVDELPSGTWMEAAEAAFEFSVEHGIDIDDHDYVILRVCLKRFVPDKPEEVVWRDAVRDVDIQTVPEALGALRAIQRDDGRYEILETSDGRPVLLSKAVCVAMYKFYDAKLIACDFGDYFDSYHRRRLWLESFAVLIDELSKTEAS